MNIGHQDNRDLPLTRLLLSNLRPPIVLILLIKPWVRCFLLLFGW